MSDQILAKAFDTSPESWMNQQMQYDMWQVKTTIGNLQVKRLDVA